MNGTIVLILVSYGIAMLGLGGAIWEWIGRRRIIRKAVDEFLITLPLMDGK